MAVCMDCIIGGSCILTKAGTRTFTAPHWQARGDRFSCTYPSARSVTRHLTVFTGLRVRHRHRRVVRPQQIRRVEYIHHRKALPPFPFHTTHATPPISYLPLPKPQSHTDLSFSKPSSNPSSRRHPYPRAKPRNPPSNTSSTAP